MLFSQEHIHTTHIVHQKQHSTPLAWNELILLILSSKYVRYIQWRNISLSLSLAIFKFDTLKQLNICLLLHKIVLIHKMHHKFLLKQDKIVLVIINMLLMIEA